MAKTFDGQTITVCEVNKRYALKPEKVRGEDGDFVEDPSRYVEMGCGVACGKDDIASTLYVWTSLQRREHGRIGATQPSRAQSEL